MQIEQISKVQGSAQSSTAELNLDTSGTSSGGTIANAQADNDPATVSNQYSSVQPFQSATPVLSAFGNGNNGNGLTLVTPDNDSGTVVGTTAAAPPRPHRPDHVLHRPRGKRVRTAARDVDIDGANPVLSCGLALLGTTRSPRSPPASPTRMFTSRLTPSQDYQLPAATAAYGGPWSIGTARRWARLEPARRGAQLGSGANNHLVQPWASDPVAAESGGMGSLRSATDRHADAPLLERHRLTRSHRGDYDVESRP
jgi:hypothetical protein